MPLFGHKNKNHATEHRSNDLSNDTYGRNDVNNRDDSNRTQDNISGNTTGHHQLHDNYYQQGGVDGTVPMAGNQPGIDSTGTGMTGHHHQQHHGHHQTPAVGAASLREQAMVHDREAQNLQAQSKELAEAEALEQKAREHRERAVAQGAHPQDKHLGGNPATAIAAEAAPHTGAGHRSGF
ncbi:hypothetical protein BC629DRAFT_1589056 [Irpex lacteus]|nr:hypothetical protein BC629DRAFT_1589056 [Irpex lacteus]